MTLNGERRTAFGRTSGGFGTFGPGIVDIGHIDADGAFIDLYQNQHSSEVRDRCEPLQHIDRIELHGGAQARFSVGQRGLGHDIADGNAGRANDVVAGRQRVAMHLNGDHNFLLRCQRRREQQERTCEQTGDSAHVSVDGSLVRDIFLRSPLRGSPSTGCRSSPRTGPARARTIRRRRSASAARRSEKLRS